MEAVITVKRCAARCTQCTFTADSKRGYALAVKHAQRTGHKIEAAVRTEIEWRERTPRSLVETIQTYEHDE